MKTLRNIIKESGFGKTYVSTRKTVCTALYRSFIKRKEGLMLEYRNKYDLSVFVETGTYLGNTCAVMLEYFDEIYSVELGMELFKQAQNRFKNEKKVHLFQGDSAKVLTQMDKMIHVPRLYWLDAHYSRGTTARGETYTPINSELDAILTNNFNSVVLIDDARLFDGTDEYPNILKLRKRLLKKYPSLVFKVSKDVIQIFHKNNLNSFSKKFKKNKLGDFLTTLKIRAGNIFYKKYVEVCAK